MLKEHDKLTAIGIHTYGGRDINSATVLDNDNHLTTYQVFCVQEMRKLDHDEVKLTTVPTGVSVYRLPIQALEINTSKSQNTGSFVDVFKTVLKVALLLFASIVALVICHSINTSTKNKNKTWLPQCGQCGQ